MRKPEEGQLETINMHSPPKIKATKTLIAEAKAIMAETDLAPRCPRSKDDEGFTPPIYESGKPTPLAFDSDQGWEVPTRQGARLDLAIRRVGAAVEARAQALRPSGTLTLTRLASMLRDIASAEKALHGKDFDWLNQKSRALSKELHDSLVEFSQVHPSQGFSSRAEYESYVDKAKNHFMMLGSPRESLKRELLRAQHQGERLTCWSLYQTRLDSEARKKALREIRPMGGSFRRNFIKEGPGKPFSTSGRFAQRITESTSEFLPSSWIKAKRQGTLQVDMRDPGDDSLAPSRWMSSPGRGEAPAPEVAYTLLAPPHQGPASGRTTDALHEMGHHMEFIYPEINQIARTHKAIRSTDYQGQLDMLERVEPGDSSPRPLRMDTTNDFGGWGRPSSFAIPYAGKETGPSASEVFSTGLEAALGGRYGSLKGHSGGSADPEHLNLVLGILATVGRQGSLREFSLRLPECLRRVSGR